MKAKYGMADPFNIHSRFGDVERAFRGLEERLLRELNSPDGDVGMESGKAEEGADGWPGRRMHPVEVEFPEYDFRGWLRGQPGQIEGFDCGKGREGNAHICLPDGRYL
jgi:hypothetical protein